MEAPVAKPSRPGNSAMALLALAVVGALVWVAFSLNEQVNPDSPSLPAPVAPSKPAVDPVTGLPPNVDFEQLPGLFAVWADHAEWNDNRTHFAYWNPVAKKYSYFFEARRMPDGHYHFTEIRTPDESDSLTVQFFHEEASGPDSEEHPFLFIHLPRSMGTGVIYEPIPKPEKAKALENQKVPVQMPSKMVPQTPPMTVETESPTEKK